MDSHQGLMEVDVAEGAVEEDEVEEVIIMIALQGGTATTTAAMVMEEEGGVVSQVQKYKIRRGRKLSLVDGVAVEAVLEEEDGVVAAAVVVQEEEGEVTTITEVVVDGVVLQKIRHRQELEADGDGTQTSEEAP